jgi:ABC-type multidrug transport system ATPase subunit
MTRPSAATLSILEDSDVAISAVGLDKRFGNKQAVDGATFSVPRGCVFGFLGPNGAGKTTVLRLLLGLVRPDGGEARVLGLDPVKQPREVRLRTGYVAQLHSLYGDLTVDENLRFFGSMYGLSGRELGDRIAEEKHRFRLEELHGAAVSLGTGVQRRVALVCALLRRPRLLILDEPTSGMDSLGRRDFWTFLNGLTADDVTIVITTHHLEEAEGCDELGLMLGGRMCFQGTPGELKTRHGGPVLVVSADPWEKGFSVLRAAFGASLFGTSSHVDGLAASPAAVAAVLEAEGVRLIGVEERPPSMEDAFLRATAEGGESAVTR